MYEHNRVGAYKKDYSSNQNDGAWLQRESIEPSVIASTGPNSDAKVKVGLVKYDENGARQKVFTTQVLDFITKTGLPFSLTETEGFRRFIYDLNPRLNCPSRKTVLFSMTERYNKVMFL